MGSAVELVPVAPFGAALAAAVGALIDAAAAPDDAGPPPPIEEPPAAAASPVVLLVGAVAEAVALGAAEVAGSAKLGLGSNEMDWWWFLANENGRKGESAGEDADVRVDDGSVYAESDEEDEVRGPSEYGNGSEPNFSIRGSGRLGPWWKPLLLPLFPE